MRSALGTGNSVLAQPPIRLLGAGRLVVPGTQWITLTPLLARRSGGGPALPALLGLSLAATLALTLPLSLTPALPRPSAPARRTMAW